MAGEHGFPVPSSRRPAHLASRAALGIAVVLHGTAPLGGHWRTRLATVQTTISGHAGRRMNARTQCRRGCCHALPSSSTAPGCCCCSCCVRGALPRLRGRRLRAGRAQGAVPCGAPCTPPLRLLPLHAHTGAHLSMLLEPPCTCSNARTGKTWWATTARGTARTGWWVRCVPPCTHLHAHRPMPGRRPQQEPTARARVRARACRHPGGRAPAGAGAGAQGWGRVQDPAII